MLLAKLVLSLARSVEEADTPPISRVEAEHGVALRAVATIEKALIPAAVSAVGVVGATAAHDVVLSAATPIAAALAKAEQLKEAVKKAKEAAERIYEAAKELWEAAKVTLQRIYEIVVEAIAKALDYVKAYWFIFAAAVAGLIAYSLAQQLDFQLWIEHVAKLAVVIAGVPSFRGVKAVLDEEGPGLFKVADYVRRVKTVEAVKKLFEAAKKAVHEGGEGGEEGKARDPEMSTAWHKLRETVINVNQHREPEERLRAEDVAALWAVFETYLKEVEGRVEEVRREVEKAVDELLRTEKAEISAGKIGEFEEFVRHIAYDFETFSDMVVRNAEEIAGGDNAQALRNTFAVSELADELAEATVDEFHKLGRATPADKALAFFKGLAEGAAWSRVVLKAVERGEAYRALALAPRTALDNYGAGVEADDKKAWREMVVRTADWLRKIGVEKFALRRNGDVVEIIVDGKVVAVVERETTEVEGIIFRCAGDLAKLHNKMAVEIVKGVVKGKAEPYQMRGLLATDGWYNPQEERIHAGTTSLVQAAKLKRLGFDTYPANYVDLTKDGPKPGLHVALSGEEGKKVIELVKSDLKDGVKRLRGDPGLRSRLLAKALEYLDQAEISVHGADKETEEGRRIIEEVRQKIRERMKKFLDELRLGEGGKVCLTGCKLMLTYKHEPYARFVAPFIHYIAEEVPKEEVMKFVADLILYDGSASPSVVYLAMGNFDVKDQSNVLPLDVYDKVALFLVFAAKYGVEVKRIYVQKTGTMMIHFDKEFAARMFTEAWAGLNADWRFGSELEQYADHLYDKLQNIRKYVEKYVKSVKTEHVLYNPPGIDPWVEVLFKDEAGREIAHINIRWAGEKLRAYFNGTKEKAERLASILSALGVDVETRKYGRERSVLLTTDSIMTIRRHEWLGAVRALVEELYRSGKIAKEQRDRLLKKIETGSNVVEIAGVEMSVRLEEGEIKSGISKKLLVIYKPRSEEAFRAAVAALRAAGFEEGVHFTTKRPEGGEKGFIRLKMPAGLWKLEELRRRGVNWAKKAVDRLEEIARARGFYDLLEKYLGPAKEAEMVDPRGMVVEDEERGIKAVIMNARLEWKEDKKGHRRPKIVVEYETGGEKKSFYFTWDAVKRVGVTASVRLDYEKAAVLAALTGDENLKERKRTTLTAKHFFALTKYVGIGWNLLWWYVEAAEERAPA
ncbi:PaRep2b protein [Pyrobaculum sp.]|uniref:PaRep2b protein n=1 Tax=Pyrobaculum sp. TaxID=2004705 RepID=UPI00315FF150